MSTEVSFWLSLIQVSHPIKIRIFRYQLHKMIWRAYPGYTLGTPQPFLFSITEKSDTDGIYCYVQSTEEPDWTKVIQTYNNSAIQLKQVHGVKSVSFLVETNDQFMFHLQVCPIKNIFQGYKKRGIKVPIHNLKDIDQWFIKKGDYHGFHPLQYETFHRHLLVRKEEHLNAKEISLASCRFTGLIEIGDAGKFKKALTCGIGPKKIFGHGMIRLARPR